MEIVRSDFRRPANLYHILLCDLGSPPPAPPLGVLYRGLLMNRANIRVLLVDDHRDTLDVMARLLKLEGYGVTCAANVTAALQLCREETFDLIITDVQLPDGSGNDLMRRLKRICRTPGIALSGLAMKAEMN